MSFLNNPAKAEETVYPAGSLLTLESLEKGAVYLIGVDEKKYMFPDEKTFMTWYENFADVITVNQETLDAYPEGGQVPYKAGVKLMTHKNTNNVYTVGENGQLIQISDEATAVKFYGSHWQDLVNDVDPGIFAVAYKKSPGILSEDNLPEGALTLDEDNGTVYFVQNGLKRKIKQEAYNNNDFGRKLLIKVKNMHQYYQDGNDIDVGDKTWCTSNFVCNPNDSDEDLEYTDLIVSDITWYPVEVNEEEDVIITIHVTNNGSIPLTSNVGIIQTSLDFEDFTTNSPTVAPEISEANPLLPGESTYFAFNGHFTSEGTKTLTAHVDQLNYVNESNENNNTFTTTIEVGSTSTNVDLSIDDITWNISSPAVDQDVRITVHILNSGNTALTSNAGILNGYRPFQDFVSPMPESIPTVSESSPLYPGETADIVWLGHFTSSGTKQLPYVVDNANELAESDENNNTFTTTIEVEE